MAKIIFATVDENGREIALYDDGEAVYGDGSPAMEKVVAPDHHRFMAIPPLSLSHLAETSGVAIT